MNELDKRIEHLDQKLKMLRGVSLCMGIALTSFILFGLNAKGPDFLALKKLTIVDEQNRPRIVFSSVIEDGVSQACIVHFDEQGRRKLWQGTEQDIISTTYYDNDQQMRLAHGVDGDREATWISFFKDNVSHSELSWTYGDEADFPSLILPHGYIAGASKVLLMRRARFELQSMPMI